MDIETTWRYRLAQGPPETERAEAYYRQAFSVSHELEMRPLQAHCHVGLGNVQVARGSAEQARAELRAAVDLYRSMEMTLWLNRADTALKALAPDAKQAAKSSN